MRFLDQSLFFGVILRRGRYFTLQMNDQHHKFILQTKQCDENFVEIA